MNRYSGITKETLESVSTRLSDVQQYLTSIISQNTILIGHSLENDLNALKVSQVVQINKLLSYSLMIQIIISFIIIKSSILRYCTLTNEDLLQNKV